MEKNNTLTKLAEGLNHIAITTDYNPIIAISKGSQNYNLDTPTSDYDMIIFTMPKLDTVINGKFDSDEIHTFEDGIISIKDIRDIDKYVLKGDINAFEFLTTPYKYICGYKHKDGHMQYDIKYIIEIMREISFIDKSIMTYPLMKSLIGMNFNAIKRYNNGNKCGKNMFTIVRNNSIMQRIAYDDFKLSDDTIFFKDKVKDHMLNVKNRLVQTQNEIDSNMKSKIKYDFDIALFSNQKLKDMVDDYEALRTDLIHHDTQKLKEEMIRIKTLTNEFVKQTIKENLI